MDKIKLLFKLTMMMINNNYYTHTYLITIYLCPTYVQKESEPLTLKSTDTGAQWLRLRAPNSGPGQGTRSHMP